MWVEEKDRSIWKRPGEKGNQLYCSVYNKVGNLCWLQESRGLEGFSPSPSLLLSHTHLKESQALEILRLQESSFNCSGGQGENQASWVVDYRTSGRGVLASHCSKPLWAPFLIRGNELNSGNNSKGNSFEDKVPCLQCYEVFGRGEISGWWQAIWPWTCHPLSGLSFLFMNLFCQSLAWEKPEVIQNGIGQCPKMPGINSSLWFFKFFRKCGLTLSKGQVTKQPVQSVPVCDFIRPLHIEPSWERLVANLLSLVIWRVGGNYSG